MQTANRDGWRSSSSARFARTGSRDEQCLHPSRQQAIITRGPPGQPNNVEIRPIMPEAMQALQFIVNLATVARKTVSFEVKPGPVSVAPRSGGAGVHVEGRGGG